MTIATIRFTAIGDIHNNIANLDKIKTFMQDMISQGKLDFASHSGDMVSSSANASQMQAVKARFDALGIRYYIATGNHDASGSNCYNQCSSTSPTPAAGCIYKTVFGHNPDQYPSTTNFTKNGVTFQLIIPGMCWSGSAFWKYNFADPSISKTAPTIVINHGPVLKPTGVTCGAWDSLHTYAFSMKPQLDALNMLAIYSGHVHAAGSQMINNRLYVVQDSVNSSRCSGTADKHRNIGYTRIDYDTSTNSATIRYQNMEYMNASNVVNKFVDPFPDVGPQILTSITISPSSASVGIGSTTQLTATCKDQNNNTMTCPSLTWSTTNSSIATVDPTGKVTGIAMGTINVTAVSGSITSNISTITVTEPPVLTSITVSPATVSVNINGTMQLTSICKDQNNNTMTCPVLAWNTSNSAVATVNSSGLVTGIATGMANITAISGAITSNSSTITVVMAPSRIVITNPTLGIVYNVGESRVVRWTHASGTGTNVKIELLKSGVLVRTISSSTPNDDAFAWTIPSVATGNDYQVRVSSTTTADTGISSNFTIQGSTPPPVLTSITVAPMSVTIGVNGTTQLISTCKDQNNNTMTCPSLTWSTTNSSIATVDSTGKVTGISAGTVSITAASGPITSNTSIITVTPPVEKKFSVFDVTQDSTINNVGVLVVLDDAGAFTKDQACVEVCNRLGQI